MRVDLDEKKIDFELVETGVSSKGTKGKKGSKGKRRNKR